MAHSDAREGKWRGKMRMEWVASSLALYVGTRSIQLLSTDPPSSTASSWLIWHPCRFKWTLFRWKTKPGFCACAITFRTYYNLLWPGQSGDRILVGKRFSGPVQPNPKAHQASCMRVLGLSWGWSSRGVLLLAPRLCVDGAVLQHPLCACIGMLWGNLKIRTFMWPNIQEKQTWYSHFPMIFQCTSSHWTRNYT